MFINFHSYRRGETLYIACQEPNCRAMGEVLNDPNSAVPERHIIVKIDEIHNHLPPIREH